MIKKEVLDYIENACVRELDEIAEHLAYAYGLRIGERRKFLDACRISAHKAEIEVTGATVDGLMLPPQLWPPAEKELTTYFRINPPYKGMWIFFEGKWERYEDIIEHVIYKWGI